MKKMTMIVLTTALGATMLLAQRPFGPRGDGDGPRGPRTDAAVELLGLDEAQVTALNENSQAFRTAVREAMQGTREKMQQFREAVENEDATLIGQLFLERGKNKARIDEIRAQYQANALQVLNDQQKAALADMQQQLEQMKQLAPAAKQATGLLLLDGPGEGPGDGPGPGFGRRGGPGAGFGGHMGGGGFGGFPRRGAE